MAPYQKTNASRRLFCAHLRWRYGAAAFVQEACRAKAAEQRRLVGLGRLELPTSRLSSARSNQLSYKPLTLFLKRIGSLLARNRLHAGWSAQAQPLARVRPRRKRNVDGEIPPMELNNPDCWPLMFLKRSDRSA